MALSDKNIVITPNVGAANAPKIVFSGADASTGAQNITLQVYPTNNGTLSFEGSAGQLLSIVNTFTGSIFSVNDVSGIPSIEVLDTGQIKLAQYSGYVSILGSETATSTSTGVLRISGGVGINRALVVGGNITGGHILATGTGNDYNTGGFETYGNGATNTIFPTYGFHQPGLYASSLQLRAASDFRFYNQGATAYANVTVAELRASSEVTAYYTSDARLKENVVLIADPIKKIMKIRGVTFDWTDKQINDRGGEDDFFVRKHDIGVIAQEIEEILPEIVATRDNGYKAVRYEKIVPLLIECIKEQQTQINQILDRLSCLISK